ncbi:TetR family transcriptional regulator [Streptomyces sp. B6B3]|uniref:TetR/AcrR family transcriptional regulator n=1 Tax=Streptomyces sp. B6B3 TaxID=3153570 RepID=UPI00325C4C4A
MAATSPTRPGLRERKKIRTRQAIQRAAYRLFAEQGYEATRVDEIADAAEVSPSTVFRYFPTKEDIVLSDEDDPLVEAALRARPAAEPPLIAVREAIRDVFRHINDSPEAMAEVRQRMHLVASVPAIRSRIHDSMALSGRMLATVLAERTGRAPEDLELRVLVAAILAGAREAALYWIENDADGALTAYIDRAFDIIDGALE